MYQLLAPTLFHNKKCRLPGIGVLSLVTNPAQTDFANGQVLAPYETIVFIEDRSDEKVFNEFSALSELLQKNLDEQGTVMLKGIGTFRKLDTGELHFSPIQLDPVFNASVEAKRVIREDASHPMLVGDQETTNVAMSEYFNDSKPVAKSRWWIWALIMGAIGLAMLLIHYYRNGFHFFSNDNLIF